ncbi:MAG TPA: hypothetical protein EYG67_04760 [Campylobacterales bacterium]|nr:hypothetical protein [Campylobacterales bacterium]
MVFNLKKGQILMHKKLLTVISLLLLSSTLLFSKTLVSVNGHTITDAIIPKGYEQLDDTKRANLMEHLIKEELIHSYILKQGIANTPAFQDAFTQQKTLAEEQYKKVSGKSLTKEQIRNIKGSIALVLYQQEQFKSTTISPAETKAFFDNNQKRFDFPDSIEIANIITKTKSEAEALINELKNSANINEAFVTTAKAHKQNGYMGWFGKGMVPDNLFNTAYKAKPKTLILKPIKTEYGYHIIYLLNKKSAGKITYAEAQENISKILKQQRVIQTLEDKINDLYGGAEIIY